MRTHSQFAKIGIPLIVVSVLVAVALILAVTLSKKPEKNDTKGKLSLPGGVILILIAWDNPFLG